MRRMTVTALCCLATGMFAPAVVGQTPLVAKRIASGLTQPTWVGGPPGDPSRLIVARQNGVMRLIKNGVLQPTNFLNLSSDTTGPGLDKVLSGGERGLIGVAFHPDYATNRYIFVHYTKQAPNAGDHIIERYTVNPDFDTADPNSAVVFLGPVDQPQSNHNAGAINFSPLDGYLYVSFGDGGGGNDPSCFAQNPATLLGKMVRLDVDANPNGPAIPAAGNPGLSDPNMLDEIWQVGLRNPYRWSFDRETGDMWIGDVGQGPTPANREEINFVPGTSVGGENYGWKVMHGTQCFSTTNCVAGTPICNAASLTDPIREYVGPTEGRAVIGGYRYRGCAIPDLEGTYFYGDNTSGKLWSFELDAGNNVINHQERTLDLDPAGTLAITGPSSFGEDACGEIYICDHDDGEIYQIVPEQVCQTDLGFQGKGPGRMTMCGGDLSTGTTADMIVCPLTPGSQMLLLGGTTNLPTQVWEVGSMLVPIPPLFAIGIAAPSESLVLPITGGGGPGSLFVQWVIQDPAATSPTGWYATNALRIDFLP